MFVFIATFMQCCSDFVLVLFRSRLLSVFLLHRYRILRQQLYTHQSACNYFQFLVRIRHAFVVRRLNDNEHVVFKIVIAKHNYMLCCLIMSFALTCRWRYCWHSLFVQKVNKIDFHAFYLSDQRVLCLR